jgi:hypothetical protein
MFCVAVILFIVSALMLKRSSGYVEPCEPRVYFVNGTGVYMDSRGSKLVIMNEVKDYSRRFAGQSYTMHL